MKQVDKVSGEKRKEARLLRTELEVLVDERTELRLGEESCVRLPDQPHDVGRALGVQRGGCRQLHDEGRRRLEAT